MSEPLAEGSPKPEKILTRIYVTAEGNLVVTDFWEEIRALLLDGGFSED